MKGLAYRALAGGVVRVGGGWKAEVEKTLIQHVPLEGVQG